MQCFCCGQETALARKARVRRWRDIDPGRGGPESAAYLSYQEEMTYRWAVVCPGCYCALDNETGLAEIAGHAFNLAGASRGGKAAVLDEAQYARWRRREAAKLGLDVPGPP